MFLLPAMTSVDQHQKNAVTSYHIQHMLTDYIILKLMRNMKTSLKLSKNLWSSAPLTFIRLDGAFVP